jgi:hypothetical protein
VIHQPSDGGQQANAPLPIARVLAFFTFIPNGGSYSDREKRYKRFLTGMGYASNAEVHQLPDPAPASSSYNLENISTAVFFFCQLFHREALDFHSLRNVSHRMVNTDRPPKKVFAFNHITSIIGVHRVFPLFERHNPEIDGGRKDPLRTSTTDFVSVKMDIHR